MSYQHQALVRGVAMKAPEKPLLLAIANYADEQGYCYPGIDTLAFDTGYSEPTVKRARKRLEEDGWLLKKRRWSTSNLYRLNLEKLAAEQSGHRARSDFIGELEFTKSAGQEQSDHTDLTGEEAPAQSDQSDLSSEITPIRRRDQSDPLTTREPVSRTNQPPLIGDAGWMDEPPRPEPQAPVAPTPGERFLASLPPSCRPDQHAVARLAAKVQQLLATEEWTPDSLRRRLTAGIESAHSPAGALVRRIEGLALPKGTEASRPAWCGECDERTRQRENDAGLPYRCPKCHPLAVGA